MKIKITQLQSLIFSALSSKNYSSRTKDGSKIYIRGYDAEAKIQARFAQGEIEIKEELINKLKEAAQT